MNVVRYDTLGVFVGPPTPSGNVPSGDIKQMTRVQSSNYSIELQRDLIVSLGSAFGNDGNVQTPFATVNFDYFVTNGENEKNLGFVVDGSHGAFTNLNSGERSYFLLVNKDEPMTLAIGNGLVTKYGISARVNDFMRANVEIRGFNIQLDQGTSGNYLPDVNRNGVPFNQYTYQLPPLQTETRDRLAGIIEDNLYIGPRQIVMRFPSGAAFGTPLSGNNKSHVQSFSFNIGLDRNELIQIGERYPFKRCLSLPTELTLSTEVLLNKYEADNMQNYFCYGGTDIEIDILSDSCTTTDDFWENEEGTVKLKYLFKGMKLRSFSSEDAIGNNKQVSISWSVPIGNLLDVGRNLFISGDWGRYAFPIDEIFSLVGEPSITGQGLSPFSKEIRYKRTKLDVKSPDSFTKFTSDLQTSLEDPTYYVYYQGSSGAVSGSGFGGELVESTFPYNSDSVSTIISSLPQSGVGQKFSTFYPKYAIGYPGYYEKQSGKYSFYVKGEGFHTEPLYIDFASLPDWLNVEAEYPSFQIDPYKPYYFNSLNLNIGAVDVPTGYAFDIEMINRNSTMKKIVKIGIETPYSFHISLPPSYLRKTSLFLQPYNETTVTKNSDNYLISLENSSYRSGTFTAITGLDQTITYRHKELNGKSYLSFDSGAMLRYTGGFMHDFRQFTMYVVYRPSGNCATDAQLLHFYQTNTGVLGYRNEAFLKRKGNSQDLEFYYVNPTGATGYYTGAHLQVTSTWDSNRWNLATIIFDGATASGYRSGALVGTASFGIPASGSFSHIDVGSGFHGDIGEIIVQPYKAHPIDKIRIEGLLNYKFGFTQ